MSRRAMAWTVLVAAILPAWADLGAADDANESLSQTVRRELVNKALDPKTDANVIEATAESLARLGAQAAPALIEHLGDGVQASQTIAFIALSDLGPAAVAAMIEALPDANQQVQMRVMSLLAELGPDAAGASGALAKLVDNADTGGWAAATLGAIGPSAKEALPALRTAMEKESVNGRAIIAWAVCRLGDPNAGIAVLHRELVAGNPLAANLLGRLGPAAKGEVPFLADAAMKPDTRLIASAMDALGHLALWDRQGVKALMTALNDHSIWQGRTQAAWYLTYVGPLAKEALPSLLKRSRQSVSALGTIGPAATDAVPELIKIAKDGNQGDQIAAAISLGLIGPGAKEALAVLTAMTKDGNDNVVICATAAIGHIRVDTEGSTRALLLLLTDKDWTIRWTAAAALGEIGPKSSWAKNALESALADPAPAVRTAAKAALDRIAGNTDRVIQDMLAIIHKGPTQESFRACWILRDMGPQSAAAAPELVKMLRSGRPVLRSEIAKILGGVGAEAKDAVAPLTEQSQSLDDIRSLEAVRALSKIIPDQP